MALDIKRSPSSNYFWRLWSHWCVSVCTGPVSTQFQNAPRVIRSQGGAGLKYRRWSEPWKQPTRPGTRCRMGGWMGGMWQVLQSTAKRWIWWAISRTKYGKGLNSTPKAFTCIVTLSKRPRRDGFVLFFGGILVSICYAPKKCCSVLAWCRQSTPGHD